MKRGLVLFLMISMLVSPAYAIENGERALGEPVSALRNSGYINATCSAALIEPRIVVTAKHCTQDKYEPSYRWEITYPGDVIDLPNPRTAKVLQLITSKGQWFDPESPQNDLDDIALLIIDRAFPIPNNLKIADTSDIERFRTSHTPTVTYGYGRYKWQELMGSNVPFKISAKLVEPNEGGYGIGSFNISVEDSKNICTGDSGGPTYALENGNMYYIGPTSATRRPSCIENPIKDPGYFGGTPLAFHPELLLRAREAVKKIEAEELAAKNAAKDAAVKATVIKKSVTITCIKGKLTKKITAVNPKCPAGYVKK